MSRLRMPCARNSATSLSRNVSPRSCPGHGWRTDSPEVRAHELLVVRDLLDRVDERLGGHRLREHAARARGARRFEPLGRERPRVHGNRAHVRIVREARDAVETEAADARTCRTARRRRIRRGCARTSSSTTSMRSRNGSQHRLQPAQHDLVVVDQGDVQQPRIRVLRDARLRLAHWVSPTRMGTTPPTSFGSTTRRVHRTPTSRRKRAGGRDRTDDRPAANRRRASGSGIDDGIEQRRDRSREVGVRRVRTRRGSGRTRRHCRTGARRGARGRRACREEAPTCPRRRIRDR